MNSTFLTHYFTTPMDHGRGMYMPSKKELREVISMRNEFFTNYDGKQLVRINKRIAHKMYINGNMVYACPVNSNPWLMGVSTIDWLMTMTDEQKEKYWNHMVNSISYYQCNAEMRHYLKFYAEKGEIK